VAKEVKDQKDRKEGKEVFKDTKDRKDTKERKDQKDQKERKEGKEQKDFKDRKDIVERRPTGGFSGGVSVPGYEIGGSDIADLQSRVAALEEALGMGQAAQPFIGSELRPDLAGGPAYEQSGASVEQRMAEGDRDAKRQFDTLPPR